MMNPNLNKRGFASESEARDELLRILETQNKPWKKEQRKPCRWYFDEELNQWFLTSKVSITIY